MLIKFCFFVFFWVFSSRSIDGFLSDLCCSFKTFQNTTAFGLKAETKDKLLKKPIYKVKN